MYILHLHPIQLFICLLMNKSLKHGGFVTLYCNQSMDKRPAGVNSITVECCAVYSRNAVGMPIILMSIT
jgi:hypothetical protein